MNPHDPLLVAIYRAYPDPEVRRGFFLTFSQILSLPTVNNR